MIVYDSGALISAERGNRHMLALHTRLLQRRVRPLVPAPVLAQVWRGGPQVTLSRVLAGCRIEDRFGESDARRIGAWLAHTATSDVVDAYVVVVASRAAGSVIYTGDVDDLNRLADLADERPNVLPIPRRP